MSPACVLKWRGLKGDPAGSCRLQEYGGHLPNSNSGAVQLLKLIASILVCQLAGVVGALFTTPAIPTWYATLSKPSFTPPSWLFSPVWIALYTLIGVAVFLIWRKGPIGRQAKIALGIFGLQLLLNVLWSVAFFGLRSPAAGIVTIALLLLAILGTILSFSRVSKAAAILLIPYILWVSFAAFLNVSISALNP